MTKLDNELESSIVQLLFDPQIRQFCGQFLEPWMFQRTVYSRLVETLINKDFRDHSVDLKVVRLYMQQNFKDVYSDDWRVIEDEWAKFSPLENNDIESVSKMFTNFIKNRMCLKGVDLYVKGDLKTGEDYFSRAGSFNILPDPFINPLQEGMVEHLRIKDLPTGGRVIKSSLGLMNTALQYGGYKTGDLIMVVMKPKSGKSTLMIQEAASAADQGFKVAHMFFGDFSEFDGICKFMSCVTGDPISNVVNCPEQYKQRCESWLKNWRVAAFPAFSLDCNEIVSYAKNLRKKFPFDLLVLDYDSNIRSPQDAGMYESGGVVYSTFKGFGQQEGHVTMIGSQPKIQFWKDEILDYACAAESSRKQHVVDVMLTGGRNDTYKGIGTFHLPLIRRGESSGITRIKFDDRNSRMKEITQLEYDNFLRENKKLQHTKDSGGDFTLQGVSFKDKPSSEMIETKPEIINVS